MQPTLVDIMTSLMLKNGRVWVRIPSRARKLGLIDNVQANSWECPYCYSMDIGRSFPVLTKLACEAEQLSLSKAEVKNASNSTSFPHMPWLSNITFCSLLLVLWFWCGGTIQYSYFANAYRIGDGRVKKGKI